MFQIDILQTQWLVLALAAGLILALCVSLYYLAAWRRRPGEETAPQPAAEGAKPRKARAIPEILALTYLFVLVYVVAYTLFAARHPPNW